MNQPVPLRRTSSLAIVSLVSGIVSWFILPLIGALAAIITGHMARAGLVLGYGQIALCVLAFIAIVLFFGGLAAILAILGANAG
jgi:hypothetical protein